MKEIKKYIDEKYQGTQYEKIEEGIYKTLEQKSTRCLVLKEVKGEVAEEVRKLENWTKYEQFNRYIQYNSIRWKYVF